MPQISTPRLKVTFQKISNNSDRWSHKIFLVDGDLETLLLTSIEGDDLQTWPPSPPLQDISHHDLPTGEAILGVGMAGKSHWSTSVSVENNSIVFFDMACLIKAVDATVGSKYEVAADVQATSVGENISLRTPSANIAMHPHHPQHHSTGLIVVGSQVNVVPDLSTKSPTGSVRWCFRLSTQ